MSHMFALSSLELLLIAGRAIGLLMGLLMFAWAFRHWRRAAMRDTQRVFEQLDLVRSELLIMKEVMHHSHRPETTARKASMEARIPAPGNNAARGYEIATRMARNGAGKEELMRNCGITNHEAELLVKLHGQRGGQAAELIGRQPRTAESAASMSPSGVAGAANASRQPASTARQSAAAPAAQRTPDRPLAAKTNGKSNALPPRSRLVAVG